MVHIIDALTAGICEAALADSGFASHPNGPYRPDETAWASVALTAANTRPHLVEAGRSRLATSQMADGRVPIADDYSAAFWPTALAILAWHNSGKFKACQTKAVNFLLSVAGKHYNKENDSIIGHDPTIKGWPWIGDTAAWLEPTALVLIALDLCKKSGHQRGREAVRMIMNRQLEDGGWNYGNTTVFGRQLRPMPLSTGMALCALDGKVEKAQVRHSLDYLKSQVGRLRSPSSLGWGLLGLSTWHERPINAGEVIAESNSKQRIYGRFRTTELGLLLLASLGGHGLPDLLNQTK